MRCALLAQPPELHREAHERVGRALALGLQPLTVRPHGPAPARSLRRTFHYRDDSRIGTRAPMSAPKATTATVTGDGHVAPARERNFPRRTGAACISGPAGCRGVGTDSVVTATTLRASGPFGGAAKLSDAGGFADVRAAEELGVRGGLFSSTTGRERAWLSILQQLAALIGSRRHIGVADARAVRG